MHWHCNDTLGFNLKTTVGRIFRQNAFASWKIAVKYGIFIKLCQHDFKTSPSSKFSTSGAPTPSPGTVIVLSGRSGLSLRRRKQRQKGLRQAHLRPKLFSDIRIFWVSFIWLLCSAKMNTAPCVHARFFQNHFSMPGCHWVSLTWVSLQKGTFIPGCHCRRAPPLQLPPFHLHLCRRDSSPGSWNYNLIIIEISGDNLFKSRCRAITIN